MICSTEIYKSSFSFLLGMFSFILVVTSCGTGKDTGKDKVARGVEAADCIRKYDKDGCNICNRVELTDEWKCSTGVSCPNLSAKDAKENSGIIYLTSQK